MRRLLMPCKFLLSNICLNSINLIYLKQAIKCVHILQSLSKPNQRLFVLPSPATTTSRSLSASLRLIGPKYHTMASSTTSISFDICVMTLINNPGPIRSFTRPCASTSIYSGPKRRLF
ncbi:hypothetical protein C0992_012587, partial [Termitomyces sp. T32_za158]